MPSSNAEVNLRRYVELAADAGLHANMTVSRSRREQLPRAEYRAFSGTGVLVCDVGGRRQVATAFLVGAFDIAVTVGHVFEHDGRWASPEDCHYLSVGPQGRIWERIALASAAIEWQVKPATFGVPAHDLAIIRLTKRSALAWRTLSFAKISAESNVPVTLLGFSADVDAGLIRRRVQGTMQPLHTRSGEQPRCYGFSSEFSARAITPGALLIDSRDAVVIGILTRTGEPEDCIGVAGGGQARSVVLPMNAWLHAQLHAEITGPR